MLEPYTLRLFGIIALAYLFSAMFAWAYNYHLIHVLHWPDSAVSILQGSWGSVATLLLIVGGGVLADRVGPGRLQRWVLLGLGGFLFGFCALGYFWHYAAFATFGLLVGNMADPALSVAAMPLLMALCRPQIEGSQFTTYMALVNLCGVGGAYLTGWLLGFVSAPVLGLICGGLVLGLLVVLRRMPARVAVAVS